MIEDISKYFLNTDRLLSRKSVLFLNFMTLIAQCSIYWDTSVMFLIPPENQHRLPLVRLLVTEFSSCDSEVSNVERRLVWIERMLSFLSQIFLNNNIILITNCYYNNDFVEAKCTPCQKLKMHQSSSAWQLHVQIILLVIIHCVKLVNYKDLKNVSKREKLSARANSYNSDTK